MIPSVNYHLAILSISFFALIASGITFLTFRKKVEGVDWWTAGYFFYFLSMLIVLVVRDSSFLFQRYILITIECVGGYCQFIGFVRYYRHKNTRNEIAIFFAMILLCASGLFFDTSGNIAQFALIKNLTLLIPTLYLLFIVVRYRKIESLLQIPTLVIFLLIAIVSSVSSLGIVLAIRPQTTAMLCQFAENSKYGIGVIFLAVLVFSQNQLANCYLQDNLSDTISTLLGYQSKLESTNEELEETKSNLVTIVAESLESRLSETSNHVRRVASFTRILLEKLDYAESDKEDIINAAALHDIGKIGIPDAILSSQNKFTESEMKIMQTHTTIGFEILSRSNTSFLRLAAAIALEHHENWDGSGYPLGKSGETIQFPSRVIAIADTFDALVNIRNYKDAWSFDDAVAFILRNSDKKFDRAIVAVLPLCLDEFRAVLKTQTPATSSPKPVYNGS